MSAADPYTSHQVGAPDPPAAAGAAPLLSVSDLAVEFATDRGPTKVTEHVSFDIMPGATIGLVGESGSGKTVTALSILGLLPKPAGRVVAGSIEYQGEDLLCATPARMRQIRGDDIAMIFQEPMSSLNPVFTIGDQIVETVRQHRRVSRKEAWQRAVEVLDIVGIPSAAKRAHEYPHHFSGGMRQRAMIAMALACEPKLLIADEPTTALDVTVQARILTILQGLQEEFGMTILLVTHDFGVVAEMCDTVVVMYAGQVVEHARSIDLFDQPLHPYTEGLLRSMPQVVGADGRMSSIPGVVPPPWDMPDGCRFHPRCPYSVAPRCTTGSIPLEPVTDRETRCVRHDEITLEGTQ